MSDKAIRFRVDSRDVPARVAARRLGLTLYEFEGHKKALFARGFPRPDATTERYDLKMIDAWMDGRNAPALRPELDAQARYKRRMKQLMERDQVAPSKPKAEF